MKALNLNGKIFGALTVIDRVENNSRGSTRWICQCECGNETIVIGSILNGGKTKSCGCKVQSTGKKSPLFMGHEEIHGKAWSGIKRGAKIRKIPFLLSIEDAWDIFIAQNKKCALTGTSLYFALTTRGRDGGETTASLDRINSSKSYTKDNVQWVHKDVNMMKQSFSQEYFLHICKDIYEHSIGPIYTGVDFSKRELSYADVSLLPTQSVVNSRSECDTSVQFGDRSFNMPVYPSNMKSVVSEETCQYLALNGWFYSMHRYGIDGAEFTRRMHSRGLFSSISLGVRNISDDYLFSLAKSAPEYITLDVANAWSPSIRDIIPRIKKILPSSFLIVGNVATPQAVMRLQKWGADAIKIGIAGGHVCITRIKTGFYRPMVSTILDCADVAIVPLIADGGIACGGDTAKALACGAHMVMAGQMFAGYDESAGDLIEIDGRKYKAYFGSASEHNKDKQKHIEGKKILVDYRGSMEEMLKELREDLQSSISYAGGRTVGALNNRRLLIEI